jgi:hypothetical protein
MCRDDSSARNQRLIWLSHNTHCTVALVLGKQYREPILNRVKIECCSWKWFESYQKNGKSAKRPHSVGSPCFFALILVEFLNRFIPRLIFQSSHRRLRTKSTHRVQRSMRRRIEPGPGPFSTALVTSRMFL